jgi:hypothetical protein
VALEGDELPVDDGLLVCGTAGFAAAPLVVALESGRFEWGLVVGFFEDVEFELVDVGVDLALLVVAPAGVGLKAESEDLGWSDQRERT